MEQKSSKPLDSAQLILINQMEENFLLFIKKKVNEERFKHLGVTVNLIIKDKARHECEYSSNESFSIPGSKALDSDLRPYVTNIRLSRDIADDYTLSWNVSYSIKEQKSQSQSPDTANKATGKDELPDFFPSKPRYSFTQIILSEGVKSEIFDALNIITNKELIYNDWGFGEVDGIPRSILNFYGEPGTGKTMCAHAIADYLKKDIMCLNYSEIESKYVGDSAKNLKKAFDTAQEKDAILFFDEADSFLGKRIQNVSQGSEQALNSLRSQMLILLEQFDGIVLFATNLVTNFDRAFESRILKHIHLELPNQEARADIIKKMLPAKVPFDRTLTQEQFMEASALIEGLSGREIKNAILDMLTHEANAKGKTARFSFDKLCHALSKRKEMIEKLKEEANKELKAKITKKLEEKSMEMRAERDAEAITDEYIVSAGFSKEGENIFVKNDIQKTCTIQKENIGKYRFQTKDMNNVPDILTQCPVMTTKGDLRKIIEELYADSLDDLSKFNL